MTDISTHTIPGVDGGRPPEQVPSRLDEIRAEFAKPLITKRLYKRLPCDAMKNRLAAEYKLLTVAEVDALDDLGDTISGASDGLIAALVGLHAHDPNDVRADKRGLVPLHIWLGIPDAGVLLLDKRLTDALGLPFGTSREILLRLFDGNELALKWQSGELGGWSTDTTAEHFQDFTTGS